MSSGPVDACAFTQPAILNCLILTHRTGVSFSTNVLIWDGAYWPRLP
jgi:hypothetical protein